MIKGHKKPITCIWFDDNNGDLYSGGKDGCILRYTKSLNYKREIFNDNKKSKFGHWSAIYAIDISHDSKYLISGG